MSPLPYRSNINYLALKRGEGSGAGQTDKRNLENSFNRRGEGQPHSGQIPVPKRREECPRPQKGYQLLVWGPGQQEDPGKLPKLHLSLGGTPVYLWGLFAQHRRQGGGWGSPITRNQSLGLGRRNTPQSVVHGTRTQVLRKVMCTHMGSQGGL